MNVTGIGFGTEIESLPFAVPVATKNRVDYNRGLLSEWYVNGPAGLEQGFTLSRPPSGTGAGPLTVSLSLSGTLVARLEDNQSRLVLSDPRGNLLLQYSGLRSS